ncbi:unnamed protein product [Phytophthora fragariaefolia]|uniref:Unnamed protein product n=1 Tax=Phytophthora fragariaefolia TaxID=1490495 RepID=A0A9W6WSI8_9STRA|nr:unnamed protein product [Phytophthora fragariaefolia]
MDARPAHPPSRIAKAAEHPDPLLRQSALQYSVPSEGLERVLQHRRLQQGLWQTLDLATGIRGAPDPEPLGNLEPKTISTQVPGLVVGPPCFLRLQILGRVRPDPFRKLLEPLLNTSNRDPVAALPEGESEVRVLGPPDSSHREMTPQLHHNGEYRSPNEIGLFGIKSSAPKVQGDCSNRVRSLCHGASDPSSRQTLGYLPPNTR